LGIIKEGNGVAAQALKNLGVDFHTLWNEIEKFIQSGPDMVPTDTLRKTPRAKKAIEYSMEEARNLNHDYVGTEHLLLGVLRQQESVAAQILIKLGVKLDEARAEVVRLLGLGLEPS
jgi:ATP-dependent Clp protease ATP-binding subunit ClpC